MNATQGSGGLASAAEMNFERNWESSEFCSLRKWCWVYWVCTSRVAGNYIHCFITAHIQQHI